MALKQGKTHFHTYFMRFEQLLVESSGHSFPDTVKITWFKNRLSDEITKTIVSVPRLQTYLKLVQIASTISDNLAELQYQGPISNRQQQRNGHSGKEGNRQSSREGNEQSAEGDAIDYVSTNATSVQKPVI